MARQGTMEDVVMGFTSKDSAIPISSLFSKLVQKGPYTEMNLGTILRDGLEQGVFYIDSFAENGKVVYIALTREGEKLWASLRR